MTSGESFVSGLSEKSAAMFNQIYQDVAEIINSVGIQTIAGYHTELAMPVVVSNSGSNYGPPVFGDGGVFGPQISGGPWTSGQILYYGTDAERNGSLYSKFANPVIGCSTIMTDSPSNPSVILLRDVDFTIPPEGDGVYFRNNPLTDSRISKQTGPDGSQQAVLWLFQVRTDDGSLELHHGYPFSTGDLKGEALRSVIGRIYAVCTAGPAPNMLESFLAVAAGQPITGGIEVVESVSSFGESQVIITSREAYVLPPGISPAHGVIPGAILHAGKPLSSVVTLWDSRTNPEWWKARSALVFPGSMVHPSLGVSYLAFPNANVQMGAVSSSADSATYALDPGVGPLTYRSSVVSRQLTAGTSAGNEVWTKMFGTLPNQVVYSDLNGTVYLGPDGDGLLADQVPNSMLLNALQILMEFLGGRNISAIVVDASGVADLVSFATLCSNLEDVSPLGAVTLIMIDTYQSDIIDCSTTSDEASLFVSLPINSDHVAISPLNEQVFLTFTDRIP